MEPLNFGLLKEWLEEKKFFRVKDALTNRNEVDIAEFLEDLPPEKMAVVFRMLPKEMAADVFAELSVETQQTIIESVTDTEISQIMNDLFVDDMVDMLEELPANVVKRVLRNATPEKRAMINQFLRYPEDSAGSIMTAEFVDLRKTMTVGAAIRKIRSTGLNKETVYTCYVTDANRRLEGEVSVKDLLMAEDEAGIESVMDANMISVVTTENQEETAKLFQNMACQSSLLR
ncbi:MAG: magnesium transporter [Clostridia bacterium]